MIVGATFSEPYALSLGVHPTAALRTIVRDAGLQIVRLCTYWDRTEPEPGRFDFRSLDWQIDEATRAGLDIILTVGQKAPRWPEYHRPRWASPENPDFEHHLLRFIEATVRRFRDARISAWQVENEPYQSFGGPPIDETLLGREIDLVRSLDARPIMLTDSADKGNWTKPARLCDILGVNLYTHVWNGRRYVDIKVSPSRYAAVARRVRETPPPPAAQSASLESPSVRDVIVSELQAEPWGPKPVAELTPNEAARTMTPDRLRHNVDLASSAGFTTALLWGAEWWLHLRARGDSSMWDAATSIIDDHGQS